jgi:hypothetical protein
METILNFINYVYDYFFKEDDVYLGYGYVKYVEPLDKEIDDLINETIKEIKLDKEINELNIRYINLIKEDEFVGDDAEGGEDDQVDNNNHNNNNEGAVPVLI